jgi:hypothetical protein
MKPLLLASHIALLFTLHQVQGEEEVIHEADICVYGGTASGVMAALAAEKEGAKVILIEPSRWLGGMTGGGINYLDWGKGNTVGGSTYKILMEGLEVKEQEHHGGHAIQGIGNKEYRERFKKVVEDRGITVIYDHRLGKVQVGDSTIDAPTRQRPIALGEDIASKDKAHSIRSITLDYAPVDETGCPIPEPKKRNAITVSAKVFVDCSYEGDVLGMSGVSYTWGRESREHYDESLAGVRPSLWVHDIDPYIEPGNPESGLIPFIQDRKIGPLGSADALSMGYCFRYEFDGSGEGIPIPEPTNYDPAEFEVYRRAIRDGVDIFSSRKMRTTLGKITEAKREPFVGGAQSNRNLMGSTVYGCNDDYPNGDWATRSRIWKFHQEFLINAIHFAKTDPSAPESMKQGAMKTTFRKGVFDETGGWPNQFYVRQARRMVSSYVVTQKDLEGKTDPPHTVGLAAYGVDDWPYAVVVEDGKVAVQGGAFSIVYIDGGKYNGSYKIPYEAIVPSKGQCDNLIVPVCVSASHIAFTSLRMEPVWMVLGESAGVAAAIAVDTEIPVQDVPYNKLRQKLDDLDQTLDRIQGANIAITAVTINDSTNDDRNIPVDTTSFQHASTLVDFTAGGTTYSNFVLVDDAAAATGSAGRNWGFSATDPGSFVATVSDDRIDTSGLNVDVDSEFEFASAPLALSDLLFIFDLGSLDAAVEIQLIDAANNLLGSSASLSGIAQIGGSSIVADGTQFSNTFNFNGVAISFDEFGITSGQLSSVDGFRVTSGVGLDINLAGHTGVVPEPSAPEITSITSITAITAIGGGVWELTLEGEADTGYEFHSSTTLDFTPGTLVESLTEVGPGVVTDGNLLTTDSSGDATVRMTLTRDPADFVRAQTAP